MLLSADKTIVICATQMTVLMADSKKTERTIRQNIRGITVKFKKQGITVNFKKTECMELRITSKSSPCRSLTINGGKV